MHPIYLPHKSQNTPVLYPTMHHCKIFLCDALWYLWDGPISRASYWVYIVSTLHWRHNERDGVSNHQPHDLLFRFRSKKTSKLRVTGLCAGNSPVTSELPTQRASNAENASNWWRHHIVSFSKTTACVYQSQTLPYPDMYSMQHSSELPSFRTFPANFADMMSPVWAPATFPYYIIQLYAVNSILAGLSPFGPHRRTFAINCSYSALAGSSD